MATHPSDEPKITFLCCFGLYVFTVLPFEMKNVLSTFQCLMHSIFHSMLDDILLNYLDDLLVFSGTVAKHE